MEDAFNDPETRALQPSLSTNDITNGKSSVIDYVTPEHKTGDPKIDSIVTELIALYVKNVGELDAYEYSRGEEGDNSDENFYIDDDNFSDIVYDWYSKPGNRQRLEDAGLVDHDDVSEKPIRPKKPNPPGPKQHPIPPQEPTLPPPPEKPNSKDLHFGTPWANAAYEKELEIYKRKIQQINRHYEEELAAYEIELDKYESGYDEEYERALEEYRDELETYREELAEYEEEYDHACRRACMNVLRNDAGYNYDG